MLNGNFSTIASPLCNANKQINLKDPRDPTGKTLFPGNQIPVSLFSKPALKMMTFYPAAEDGCGTLHYGVIANQDEHMGIAKADYQLNTKQTLFLRYFVTHSLQPTPYDGNESAFGNALRRGRYGQLRRLRPHLRDQPEHG